jgi:hypothetical protein
MTSAPLKPFAPPTTLPFVQSGSMSMQIALVWFFYFALAYWIIYTIVAVYHWFTYAHSPSVAVPATALHLFVSFVLLSYAISGIF